MLKAFKALAGVTALVLGLINTASADCYVQGTSGNILIKDGVVKNGVCQVPLTPGISCRYIVGPYSFFMRNCPVKY